MSDILKDITPLPWSVGSDQGDKQSIYSGRRIARTCGGELISDETNARYIVAACNAYPDLVAALETAESDCQLAINVLGNNGPEFDSVRRSFAIIRDRITLALAKAKQS